MEKKDVHITIKASTWRRLNTIKNPGESFSKVIDDLIAMAAHPEKA